MDSGGFKVVSEVSGNYSNWEQQPLVNRGLNERASNLIVSIGNFTHNANCPRVRDAQSGVGEYKRGVAWPEGSAPRTGGRFKLLLAQLHTLSKTHSTRQLQHFSTVSTTVTVKRTENE